jgi:hypothetical protein
VFVKLRGTRSAYRRGQPGVYGHARQSPKGDEPPSRACPFGLPDLIARFRTMATSAAPTAFIVPEAGVFLEDDRSWVASTGTGISTQSRCEPAVPRDDHRRELDWAHRTSATLQGSDRRIVNLSKWTWPMLLEQPAQRPERTREAQAMAYRILVVEDEPDTRELRAPAEGVRMGPGNQSTSSSPSSPII